MSQSSIAIINYQRQLLTFFLNQDSDSDSDRDRDRNTDSDGDSDGDKFKNG